MTNEDKAHALHFMRKYGGGFVRTLAEAYLLADASNRDRIEKAFPDYFESYAKRFKAQVELMP